MGNDDDGWLVATRWTAEGTHLGGTLLGEPTGRRCRVWGITQSEVRDGRVLREWQLFNEFDLMMQVCAART